MTDTWQDETVQALKQGYQEEIDKLQSRLTALEQAAVKVMRNSTKWIGNLPGTHYYTVSAAEFDALAHLLPAEGETR